MRGIFFRTKGLVEVLMAYVLTVFSKFKKHIWFWLWYFTSVCWTWVYYISIFFPVKWKRVRRQFIAYSSQFGVFTRTWNTGAVWGRFDNNTSRNGRGAEKNSLCEQFSGGNPGGLTKANGRGCSRGTPLYWINKLGCIQFCLEQVFMLIFAVWN